MKTRIFAAMIFCFCILTLAPMAQAVQFEGEDSVSGPVQGRYSFSIPQNGPASQAPQYPAGNGSNGHYGNQPPNSGSSGYNAANYGRVTENRKPEPTPATKKDVAGVQKQVNGLKNQVGKVDDKVNKLIKDTKEVIGNHATKIKNVDGNVTKITQRLEALENGLDQRIDARVDPKLQQLETNLTDKIQKVVQSIASSQIMAFLAIMLGVGVGILLILLYLSIRRDRKSAKKTPSDEEPPADKPQTAKAA